MNAVIFIGIQASGKSTFYRTHFFNTHVRINLDMLRTRPREDRLLDTCLDIEQPFVIDNTNVTRSDRARYLPRLRDAGVPVSGYYFQSSIEPCIARNDARSESERVPIAGLLGTHAKLELPELREGFAELFYVRLADDGGFIVEEWQQ